MHKRYLVTLTTAERTALQDLIATGTGAARRLAPARILLKADQHPAGPAWTADAIAAAVELGAAPVERVRRRFVEHGWDAALDPYVVEHPPPRSRQLDGEQEARLVALACSVPPPGQARWTLRLLADRLVELDVVDAISYATVRRTLKQTRSSPGKSAKG
jgi:hypothetical protein